MKFLFEGGTSNFWSNIDGSGGGSWGGSDGGFAAQNTLTVAQLVFVGLQKMWGGGGSGAEAHGNEPYELEGVEVIAPKWYQKAWKWVKGINFHFDFSLEVTSGIRIANAGTLNNKSGFDINVFSATLFKHATSFDVGTNNVEAVPESETYIIPYNGTFEHTSQGLEFGIKGVGIEVSRSWEGDPTNTDPVEKKGNIGYGVGEIEVIENTSKPELPPDRSGGSYINLGYKGAFGFGIDFKIRIGFSHD